MKINNLIIQQFFEICVKNVVYIGCCLEENMWQHGFGAGNMSTWLRKMQPCVKERGRDMTEFEGKHMGAASKAPSFGLINSSDRSQELHICNLHVLSALPISAL